MFRRLRQPSQFRVILDRRSVVFDRRQRVVLFTHPRRVHPRRRRVVILPQLLSALRNRDVRRARAVPRLREFIPVRG